MPGKNYSGGQHNRYFLEQILRVQITGKEFALHHRHRRVMFRDNPDILRCEQDDVIAQAGIGAVKSINNAEHEIAHLVAIIAVKFHEFHDYGAVRLDIIRRTPFLIGSLWDAYRDLAGFFVRGNTQRLHRRQFLFLRTITLSLFRGDVVLFLAELENGLFDCVPDT